MERTQVPVRSDGRSVCGVVIGPKPDLFSGRDAPKPERQHWTADFVHALHTASEPVHARLQYETGLYTYNFVRIRFHPRLDPPGDNPRVGFYTTLEQRVFVPCRTSWSATIRARAVEYNLRVPRISIFTTSGLCTYWLSIGISAGRV
jgi:hypothetical protein